MPLLNNEVTARSVLRASSGSAVFPVSVASAWTDAVLDVSAADNSGSSVTTIAQINAAQSATHITKLVKVAGLGTLAQVRLMYDDGLTGITAPVVEVFGLDQDGNIQKLTSVGGNITATLTPAVTDAFDGTYGYTVCTSTETFPLAGATYIFIGVKTALAATGTVATSRLQVKLGNAESFAFDADVTLGTVSLSSAQVTTLTPPTAAAIGTAVAAPSATAIGTAVAAPTAAAIASAIVANPPTVPVTGPPSAADIATAIAALEPVVAVGVPGVVVVGATTTVVLAADSDRVTAVLVNDSNEKIYIGIGDDAVSGSGTPLAAGAGVGLTRADGAALAINAICASGSKNLAIQTTSVAGA